VSDPDLLAQKLPNIFYAYSVTLDPGDVEAWTTVARSTADEAGVVTAGELVLAAHGQGISGGLRAHLVERLRAEHDGAFPSEGHDGELRALSSAALVALLANGVDAVSSVAAFGVLAADFNGWTSPAATLPELARGSLRRRGTEARRRDDLPEVRAATVTGKLASIKDVQWTAPMEAHPHIEAQASALRSLARLTEQLVSAVEARQDAHDEEVDLLWWAVNGRDAQGRPWGPMPLGLRIALAAYEAADKTRFIPGPESIETLILRAVGETDEEALVTEVIAQAASGWEEARQSPAEQRGPLLPLLSALSEAVEMEGNDSWVEVVKHKHHAALPDRARVADLAGEFYREFLAVHVLTEDAEH
jgi:hypothetical protein